MADKTNEPKGRLTQLLYKMIDKQDNYDNIYINKSILSVSASLFFLNIEAFTAQIGPEPKKENLAPLKTTTSPGGCFLF